jgi:hypothetical protein
MSDCTPSLAGRTRSRFRPGAAVAIIAVLVIGASIALRNRDPTRPDQLGRLVGSGDAAGFNLLLVTLDTVPGDCFVRQHRYRDALAQCEQAIRVDEQRFGSIARDRMHRLKKQVPSGDSP